MEVLFGFSIVTLVVVACYLDTKARMVRIDRKLQLLLKQSGIDPLQAMSISERVKQLASDPARKIEAITVHREETGAGLAEAKDAVEAFINRR